jgi:hypothetical protein
VHGGGREDPRAGDHRVRLRDPPPRRGVTLRYACARTECRGYVTQLDGTTGAATINVEGHGCLRGYGCGQLIAEPYGACLEHEVDGCPALAWLETAQAQVVKAWLRAWQAEHRPETPEAGVHAFAQLLRLAGERTCCWPSVDDMQRELFAISERWDPENSGYLGD